MPNLDGQSFSLTKIYVLQVLTVRPHMTRRFCDVADPPVRPNDTNHLDDEQLWAERHHDVLFARSVACAWLENANGLVREASAGA